MARGWTDKAKKNFVNLVRDTLAKQSEKKQIAYTANKQEFDAGDYVVGQLTDVETGADNNHRVGNEILGSRFEGTITLANTTNNDLLVRVALLEQSGIGETGDLTGDSVILQSPLGNAVNLNDASGLMANATVMWPFNQQGAIKVLKQQVVKIPRMNDGAASNTRTLKWYVPWMKRIRYISPTQQGANAQNKRVSLLITAWSPNGGTQSSYTYTVDALMRFFYVDS